MAANDHQDHDDQRDHHRPIIIAKMDDVDPQAWLADVLARIAGHPAHKLDALLPWSWQPRERREVA